MRQEHTRIKRIPASRNYLRKRHSQFIKALHGYMNRYRKRIRKHPDPPA